MDATVGSQLDAALTALEEQQTRDRQRMEEVTSAHSGWIEDLQTRLAVLERPEPPAEPPVRLFVPHPGNIAPEGDSRVESLCHLVDEVWLTGGLREKAQAMRGLGVTVLRFVSTLSEEQTPIGSVAKDAAGNEVRLRYFPDHRCSDILTAGNAARKARAIVAAGDYGDGQMLDDWSLSCQERGVLTSDPVGYTHPEWNSALEKIAADVLAIAGCATLNVGRVVGPNTLGRSHVDIINALFDPPVGVPRVFDEHFPQARPGWSLLTAVQERLKCRAPLDCYVAVPNLPREDWIGQVSHAAALFLAIRKPGDAFGISADPESSWTSRDQQVDLTLDLLGEFGAYVRRMANDLGTRQSLALPTDAEHPWLEAVFSGGMVRVNLAAYKWEVL